MYKPAESHYLDFWVDFNEGNSSILLFCQFDDGASSNFWNALTIFVRILFSYISKLHYRRIFPLKKVEQVTKLRLINSHTRYLLALASLLNINGLSRNHLYIINSFSIQPSTSFSNDSFSIEHSSFV